MSKKYLQYGSKRVIDISALETDEERNEVIIAEGLHLKFDHQLDEMHTSHQDKLPLVQKELYWLGLFPDYKRKEIAESFENAESVWTPQMVEEEFQSQADYYAWKRAKLEAVVALLDKEKEFRENKKYKRNPKGTTYYIDFDNGDDTLNDGSTPTKSDGDGPWATLDKFCENARAAGDKAIIRRAMIQTVTSDLIFTSDGDVDNPILLEADYGDAWSDFVDLSGTGTATLTFGSKTVTFSADISGVLSAHDWIYVYGDDIREFAYEVASVSTVTVTLYLPYKGGQAGSGKTTYNIKAAPIWNTAAGDFETNIDGDNFWKFQGLHFRGTDINGVVELDSVYVHIFKDVIFEGNGGTDYPIYNKDDQAYFKAIKCRFYNYQAAIYSVGGASAPLAECWDCLFDNGVYGLSVSRWCVFYIYDCEFSNHGSGDIYMTGAYPGRVYGRNNLFSSGTEIDEHDIQPLQRAYLEDHDQTVGDNRQLTGFSTAEGTPILQSETTKVRAGGGATSIKCTPSTKLSTNWELSRVLLFEYPVYAVKDVAKTYTVYLSSDDDTDWDADPTNTELWIEAEYWGHATNVHRAILKSTEVCNNFDADDTVWDTLTVTVTPLQTGVLYLRGYYCKTKEAAKSNIFYTDTKVVIS